MRWRHLWTYEIWEVVYHWRHYNRWVQAWPLLHSRNKVMLTYPRMCGRSLDSGPSHDNTSMTRLETSYGSWSALLKVEPMATITLNTIRNSSRYRACPTTEIYKVAESQWETRSSKNKPTTVRRLQKLVITAVKRKTCSWGRKWRLSPGCPGQVTSFLIS